MSIAASDTITVDSSGRIVMEVMSEIWNNRIAKLKSLEETHRRLSSPSNFTQSQEEPQASKFLAPELCAAIQNGDTTKFVSELEKIADRGVHVSVTVNQVSRAGNTILHIAANYGRQEILRLIADHFPELITRTNIKGDTVVHVAARAQNSVLIEIIRTCYARHSANNFYGDNKEPLRRIRNEYGNTALHEAVMTSNVEGAELLFTADKVVAHYLNKEAKSPLFLAVETGNSEIADLLLQAPFQHEERHQGTSPLHAAILARSSGQRTKHSLSQSFVEGWLINPEPSMPSEAKRSSLTAINPKDMMVELVKKRPELIYMRDQKGGTPLHCAASIGHLESVGIIVKASPLSALEWNTKGHLPIHVACRKGHIHVVKELVQQQWFDPMDSLNQKGQNILHIAAKSGKDTVVKYILSKKHFKNILNERDKNGNTPLHLASKYLYPKVLLLLIQEKRLNINLVNNEGLTARDIVILRSKIPSTFRELLSFAILKSIGAPLSEKGRKIRRSLTQPPQIEWIKDRVSTILLVAILVATVSFAAGFTVPGGVYSSDDRHTEERGMATFLDRKMFQLFTICNVIAMYSSTLGSFILLWAQLGDFYIAFSATYFAYYLVGLALVTMSVAFMAAVHLVVSSLSWLADIVMIIGIIFLIMFLGVYILLIFPLGARPSFLRPITYFIFRMIIPFTGSYRKVKIKKMKKLREPEKDNAKDETLAKEGGDTS